MAKNPNHTVSCGYPNDVTKQKSCLEYLVVHDIYIILYNCNSDEFLLIFNLILYRFLKLGLYRILIWPDIRLSSKYIEKKRKFLAFNKTYQQFNRISSRISCYPASRIPGKWNRISGTTLPQISFRSPGTSASLRAVSTSVT